MRGDRAGTSRRPCIGGIFRGWWAGTCEGIAREPKKARLDIDGPATVSATRDVIDGGVRWRCWREDIVDGVPEQRPGPDWVDGLDDWPDWHEVVEKAQRKLARSSREGTERAKWVWQL